MLKDLLTKKDIKEIEDYNFGYLLKLDILEAIKDINKVIASLKDNGVEKRAIYYNAFIEDRLSYYKLTGKEDFESWLILKKEEIKRLLDNARYIKDKITLKLLVNTIR